WHSQDMIHITMVTCDRLCVSLKEGVSQTDAAAIIIFALVLPFRGFVMVLFPMGRRGIKQPTPSIISGEKIKTRR
ncbi:hypothetical protein BCR42DRAFT_423265, partial [Absidia repens]